jgi:lipopolysaccharide transport system permease protein
VTLVESTPNAVAAELPNEVGRPTPARLTIIEARPGWHLIDWREIWRYRELLGILAWRDVKVRYKQTVLGAAWAVLQPLANMLVFTLFFRRLAGDNPSGVPYPLFAFAGFLPWFFFSNAVTAAAQSVVGNQSLVTKVYFPRLLIPLSAVGPFLLDLAIGVVLLIALAVAFGHPPGLTLVALVPVVALLTMAATGVGTLLAALTVAYRDFRYVVPFMMQFWMFATPSIFMNAADAVGPRWAAWLPLNPAYGLVINFRAAALGTPFDVYALLVSSAAALAGLVLGCLYFRRVERGFADII